MKKLSNSGTEKIEINISVDVDQAKKRSNWPAVLGIIGALILVIPELIKILN